MAENPLIEVRNLVKRYPLKPGLFSVAKEKVHAVNGVSFDIPMGKTLGLVGESGCGKTTTGKMLLRLVDADSGEFFFDGSTDVFALPKEGLKAVRSRMQYIFQDPYASLDPKMQIRHIVTEPLKYADRLRTGDTDARAAELLDRVGLHAGDIRKYPHEFSGGQRQRISIARALSNRPSFIVCDEPVSSLDVSVQSQILNLLIDIQNEYGITYLFIAHNLAVVFYLSDFVAVMYAGRIVERAASKELYGKPLHPYTKLLLDTLPGRLGPGRQEDTGSVPSLIHLPPGCVFHPRCPIGGPECLEAVPPLTEGAPGHFTACIKYRSL